MGPQYNPSDRKKKAIDIMPIPPLVFEINLWFNYLFYNSLWRVMIKYKNTKRLGQKNASKAHQIKWPCICVCLCVLFCNVIISSFCKGTLTVLTNFPIDDPHYYYYYGWCFFFIFSRDTFQWHTHKIYIFLTLSFLWVWMKRAWLCKGFSRKRYKGWLYMWIIFNI